MQFAIDPKTQTNDYGIYILKHSPNETTSQFHHQYKDNKIQQTTPPKNNNQLIPVEYQNSFQNLPDNDKIECVNFLKKSTYYKKCALALLESNEIAFEFCRSLIEKEE